MPTREDSIEEGLSEVTATPPKEETSTQLEEQPEEKPQKEKEEDPWI